jgi:hypothetical protein
MAASHPFTVITTTFYRDDIPPDLQPYGECRLEMLRTDKEPSLRTKCALPDGTPAFRLTVNDPLDEIGYSVSFYGYRITHAAEMQDAPTVRILGSPDTITLLAAYSARRLVLGQFM